MLWIVFLLTAISSTSVFSKNETHLNEKMNSTIDYPSGQDTVIRTLKEIASRVR